ncbi:MAG: hypothetical protein IID00_00170 [Chloroflexi bacterium]|nr:hypothetical protein [Chloroflexota bacterium]
MKLENRCLVPASVDKTWALLLDIPQAAPCIPGVQDVVADGENRFKAVMQVRIGPVRLNFSGTISVVGQDKEKGEARFRIEAADRRVGGSIRADLTMQITSISPEETEMVITSDTVFMGKIGELGQPIIRRKANSTLQDFARNLAKQAQS